MDINYYRQHTPPSSIEVIGPESVQAALLSSASSRGTLYSQDWSPASVMTHFTTPDVSPDTYCRASTTISNGPLLLPKARIQDTITEPMAEPSSHVRNSFITSSGFPIAFGPKLHPEMFRRSTSPPQYLISPVSAPSPCDPFLNVDPNLSGSGRPSLRDVRSRSASAIRSSHSRNGSSSSVDAAALSRYGYPTYRHSPQPVGGSPMSRTPSALSHLIPIAMPSGQVQSTSYASQRRTISPSAPLSRLSVEVERDPVLETETTRMQDYLTSSNPTPSLVQRTVEATRGQSHFWFDVRNLRSWSDFNVATLAKVPGLVRLLQIPVNASLLLPPGRVNTNPETHAHLHDLCASHYATKVNAALRLALGDAHIAMRSLRSAPETRQQPEFVSRYDSDIEKTFSGSGDGRGRVVGVVKCWEQWNTSMRSDSPAQKVKYLQGLSHLHRFMREHGCRYGFIMTEIELLCVRCGGPPSKENDVPVFGFLEVAEPIPLANHCRAEDGIKMTAALALFYLHMMAKNEPLPGHYGWKLDVGAAAARTRTHHMKRDDWMPKPNQSETREAKRVRGWVWPDEPLSRRETGRHRRTGSKF